MNLIHLIFASASAQLRKAREPVALIADAQIEHVDAGLKSGKKRSKDFTQRVPASAVALQLESVEDPIALEYAMAPSYSNRMANYGEPLDRMAVRPSYSNRIYDDGDFFAHAPQGHGGEGARGTDLIFGQDLDYDESQDTPFEKELHSIVEYVLFHHYTGHFRGPVYPWPLPFVERDEGYDAWSKLTALSRKYNVAMWRIFDGSTTYDYEGRHPSSSEGSAMLNEKPYTCVDFRLECQCNVTRILESGRISAREHAQNFCRSARYREMTNLLDAELLSILLRYDAHYDGPVHPWPFASVREETWPILRALSKEYNKRMYWFFTPENKHNLQEIGNSCVDLRRQAGDDYLRARTFCDYTTRKEELGLRIVKDSIERGMTPEQESAIRKNILALRILKWKLKGGSDPFEGTWIERGF